MGNEEQKQAVKLSKSITMTTRTENYFTLALYIIFVFGAGCAAIQIFALLIAFSEPIVLFGIKIINSLCRFGGVLNGM